MIGRYFVIAAVFSAVSANAWGEQRFDLGYAGLLDQAARETEKSKRDIDDYSKGHYQPSNNPAVGENQNHSTGPGVSERNSGKYGRVPDYGSQAPSKDRGNSCRNGNLNCD